MPLVGQSPLKSTLSVSSEEGKGGTLTVTGDQIDVDGNSQLLAKGS